MTEPFPPALRLTWDRQSVWSQVAEQLRSAIRVSRTLVLGLSMVGAVLAAVAVSISVDTTVGAALSIASAASLLSVPIVRSRADRQAISDWTQARSAAEALKSEVFLYLTRTGAYAGGDRDNVLSKSLDAMEQEASELLHYGLGIDAVDRDPPAVRDLESYIAGRVRDQIDTYYRPEAANLKRRVTQMRRTELGLALVGAILAAVAGATGAEGIGVWVPVVTTIAGAVTSHATAERYDFLLVTYAKTAADLERLCRRFHAAAGISDEEFVRACERLISLENGGWRAKLMNADA